MLRFRAYIFLFEAKGLGRGERKVKGEPGNQISSCYPFNTSRTWTLGPGEHQGPNSAMDMSFAPHTSGQLSDEETCPLS